MASVLQPIIAGLDVGAILHQGNALKNASEATNNLDQIMAFKGSDGRVFGFHVSNLEVAELSEDSWSYLRGASPSQTSLNSDALNDLKLWNASISNDVVDISSGKATSLQSISINVTQVCNLACTYCAAGGDGTYGDPVKKISVDRTIPQLKMLMEKAQAGSLFQINFLGGEPLLYADGIRVIAEVARTLADRMNIRVQFSMVTNGTLLTESNIALINDLQAAVTVSIDGDATVNDQRRPSLSGKGVTEKVVAGIQRLVAQRTDLVRVGVSGVFGPDHLALQEAWQFYCRLGVDFYDFSFDHEKGSEADSQTFAAKLNQIARQAYFQGGEAELRKIVIFDKYFDRLDRQTRITNHCGAGSSYVAVDAKNQVAACHWLIGKPSEVIGNHKGIVESRTAEFSKSQIEKAGCNTCWAKYLCGGGCMFVHYSQSGDKHRIDAKFCERLKSILQTTIELYWAARKDDGLHGSTEFEAQQLVEVS